MRRDPALLAQTLANLRLGPALDAVFADPALAAIRQSSCLVVNQGATQLYAYRPTAPEIPASNLKLLTATAVFDRLGPTAHLVTQVRADHAPVGGTVTGNLYLVGGGDPLLRTPAYVATLAHPETVFTNLDLLAAQVRAAGIVRVTGAVVGDESRYDTQRAVPSWKPSYVADGEAGPLSALEVNDGFASFRPDVAAPRPAVEAAATFVAALRSQGVIVGGPPAQAATPAAAVAITALASPPLADVMAEVLRQSDNTGAELLTKELGRAAGAAPTTTAGVAAMRAGLQADGLPVGQLAAVDGSGLDRSDRATCQLVLDALRAGRAGQPARPGPARGGPVRHPREALRRDAGGRAAAGQDGNPRRRRRPQRLRRPAPPPRGLRSGRDRRAPAGAAMTTGLTFSLILNGLPDAAAGAGHRGPRRYRPRHVPPGPAARAAGAATHGAAVTAPLPAVPS